VTERWTELSPETATSVLANLRADERASDPWQQIIDLARVDPACRQAVDAVRYGRMSIQEATLALALCQTKRAMALHEQAVELLKLMPMPPIVIPASQWRGPTHEGPTTAPNIE